MFVLPLSGVNLVSSVLHQFSQVHFNVIIKVLVHYQSTN